MIRIAGASFSYDGLRPVLEGIDLAIGPGVTLLLGPNGSGKSTLLRLAAGVERPDAGTVAVEGGDLWGDEAAARARLAYVPEHPDLTPYASLAEVARLVARLRGAPEGSAEAALERAGLAGCAGRTVRELSLGQRRRALVAAAWIGDPRVVLLDEPLEGMDLAMRSAIVAWVGSLAAGGACVLAATHDLEAFAPLASRAIGMNAGRPMVLDPLPADPAERLALLATMARGSFTRRAPS